MNTETRITRLEKEVERQKPQEEYTVEYEQDGFVMICKVGSKVVARFESGNINYRDDL